MDLDDAESFLFTRTKVKKPVMPKTRGKGPLTGPHADSWHRDPRVTKGFLGEEMKTGHDFFVS